MGAGGAAPLSDGRKIEASPAPCTKADEQWLPPKSSLHPGVYISIWIMVSCTVIIFNKYLLSYKNFPFPIFFTTWHMIFSAVATHVLARTTSLVETVEIDRKMFCKAILPIGVFFSASLILSNHAYLHLSVAFIQMLKATTPAGVLFMRWLLAAEMPTATTVYKVLVIITGTVMLSYGEVQFSMIGFLCQMMGILSEATRLVLVQKLLQDFKMDPLCGLYYFAPVCAVFNGILFFVVEWPKISLQDVQDVGILLLTVNGACAFALNVAVVFLIGKTSSLVLTLSGILKDILLIVFSIVVWQTPVGPLQVAGYGIAIFGLFWYKNGTLPVPGDWISAVQGSKRRTAFALTALAIVVAGSVLYLTVSEKNSTEREHTDLTTMEDIAISAGQALDT